jgi:enoyl-CoA hydratase
MSVRVEQDGPITTITLDRPEKRNAVDRATAEALAAAFRAFDADGSQSVAVLTGVGGTFCAGADLTGLDNRIEADGDGPMGPTRLRLSKPVIAAVEGYAVAGGLELALWCDLRVASEDATFGVFCRRWGVPMIDGGTIRLPRLIGTSRATDLVLTGRPVDATEAERIGLVNRVVPTGDALAAARNWRASSRRSHRTAYATTGKDCSTSTGSTRLLRSSASSSTDSARSRRGPTRAPVGSATVRAVTARSDGVSRTRSAPAAIVRSTPSLR